MKVGLWYVPGSVGSYGLGMIGIQHGTVHCLHYGLGQHFMTTVTVLPVHILGNHHLGLKPSDLFYYEALHFIGIVYF